MVRREAAFFAQQPESFWPETTFAQQPESCSGEPVFVLHTVFRQMLPDRCGVMYVKMALLPQEHGMLPKKPPKKQMVAIAHTVADNECFPISEIFTVKFVQK